MSDDYLWNRSGAPDPDVERLEDLLAPLAHTAALRSSSVDELRPRRNRKLVAIGSIAIAVAASVAVWLAMRPRDPSACSGSSGFAFVGVGGAVSCGDHRLAKGTLPIGGTLDTGPHEAELAIADIGKAKLGKHTRVSLSRTDRERHQLSIDRGYLHARVVAPPRLFAVTTKSAEVVDLGCEYEIDVDERGAGTFKVHSGRIELATPSGAIVLAPWGTRGKILPGKIPGIPMVWDVTPEVEAAVNAYLAGDPDAVTRLLEIATSDDAFTLVELAVLDVTHRRAVLERLGALSPPPDGVTVEDAVASAQALEAWVQYLAHEDFWRN